MKVRQILTLIISIANVNQNPTADAGVDRAVYEGDIVTLDGTRSSDPDVGDTLTYFWEQQFQGNSSLPVTLTGGDTPRPTFTAPQVNTLREQLVFLLTVDDGNGGTDIDDVTITVNNGTRPIPDNRNQRSSSGSDKPVIDPSMASNMQVIGEIPSHITSIIDTLDESDPIPPIRVVDDDDDGAFDFPLEINGYGYIIDESYSNTILPQTVTVGELTHIAFTAYSTSDIDHFVMFLNLDGGDVVYPSDTYITYLNGRITIIDPHDYIADATIVIDADPEASYKIVILTTIEFEDPMGLTNMVVRIWNDSSQSTNIRILDALYVVLDEEDPIEPEEPSPSPKTMPTAPDPEPTVNDNTDDDSGDVLLNIKMWAGFDSQSISDAQLLESLNLDYPDANIPGWVMTDLAAFAVKGYITIDEFKTALMFVLETV